MIESEFDTSLKRLDTAHLWRERLSTRRLTAISAALASAPVIAAMILDPMRETILGIVPLLMLAVALIIGLAYPLIVLVTAASFAGRESDREDYKTLRLDGIQPSAIAAAYTNAIDFRLRHLRAASMGVAVAAVLSLCHIMMKGFMSATWILSASRLRRGASTVFAAETPFETLFFSLLINLVVAAAVVFVVGVISVIAVQLGAYIGLRWKNNTSPIIAPLIAAALGIVLAITYVVYRWPHLWLLVAFGILVGVPLLSMSIVRFTERKVEAQIKERLTQSTINYIQPFP